MTTPLSELQNYIFVSKYARWLPEKKRRETWKEAVDRMRNMMLDRFPGEAANINWAYDMVQKKKVLGSQRALQYGGRPIEKNNARIYNCTSSYCDRAKFFQECMWLLLAGSGTGFSVQKHHVAKLPRITRSPMSRIGVYQIPDTIEGWADSIGVLLSNYFEDPIYPEYGPDKYCRVTFDYSLIRPEGSPLSSGVGKAPGSGPLRHAHNRIRALLDELLEQGVDKLRPIHAYDIVMHIADAVLSGGVRRSATLAMFSPDDHEMMAAKTGDWMEKHPHRARSNNSVVLIKDRTKAADFAKIMESVKEFGEPGFVWSESYEMLFNPCVEIGMWAYDIVDQKLYDKYLETHSVYDKIECDPELIGLKSGWQGCNLSTINCASVVDEQDFYDRCRAAAMIGTYQASFTDLFYLGQTSRNIFEREALLGVSMTGVMEKVDIVLVPEIQRKGAHIVLDTNAEIAALIGINMAARVTAVKPEGTSTLVLGLLAAGIGEHHSKRGIRNVQGNALETVFMFFQKKNPQACQKSVWAANDTDQVISFPFEIPDGAKTRNQMPAIEMLKVVRGTKENWVDAGKRHDLCTQPYLSHNVSNTITVCPDEWEDVTKYIFKHRECFAGISLLPLSGDKDYPQAPFTAVHTSREIVKEYGDASLWCSGLIEQGLAIYGQDLWKACDAAMKEEDEVDEFKLSWQKKARQFARRYFDGDTKKLTYCLKDVYNWKLYCDLNRTFSKVDYTEMVEETDNTKHEQEIACAGGACSRI